MSFVHTCGHRCGELWITLSTALSTTGDNRTVSALETPRAHPHYPPHRRTPGSTAVHSGVPSLWLTRSDDAPCRDAPHIICDMRLHAVRTLGRPEIPPSQGPKRVIHRPSHSTGRRTPQAVALHRPSQPTGRRSPQGSDVLRARHLTFPSLTTPARRCPPPSHEGSPTTSSSMPRPGRPPSSHEGSPRRRALIASARRTMRRLDSARRGKARDGSIGRIRPAPAEGEVGRSDPGA